VVGLLAAAWMAFAPSALAAGWLPHADSAEWTYKWSDSVYATTPTLEKVTVKENKFPSFTLAWTSDGLDNPADAVKESGTMTFQDTTMGLVASDWSSSPPPPSFPILCSQLAGCPNALSGTLYNLIWGSRTPTIAEPVLAGRAFTSVGGASLDVTSSSEYLGIEEIKVPAFPDPVRAAKIRSEVTQAGALGDPYGSGLRTTWWVYGVGPVRIEFQHDGGASAPVTIAELQTTNQTPSPAPSDVNYFPLNKGLTLKYRWANKKLFGKTSEVQKFTIDAVVNNAARFTVRDVSGPVKVAGSYGFNMTLDGVANQWAVVQAATRVKFPQLGPSSKPKDKRRHFFTPFDMLTFGMSNVLSAYPATGDSWTTRKTSRDYSVFGVDGETKIVGIDSVTVPAGTFSALVVRSTLSQPGFRFGSGTRTAWFAPGKGLVKLVFAHQIGGTSTVELLK
jgi:hypothetical protein